MKKIKQKETIERVKANPINLSALFRRPTHNLLYFRKAAMVQ